MNDVVGSLVWSVMLLLGLVMAGVIAIYVAGRLRLWVRDTGSEESKLLEQFRELYESGELTAEEFRRVRERLGRRRV